MPRPTEAQILTSFLLTPATLPTIILFSVFASYFPSSEKNSPDVKRLYHAIQQRRALLTDAIAKNIGIEVRNGKRQREQILRARKTRGEEDDEEILVEQALFGSTSNLSQSPRSKRHTIETLIPEMETGAAKLEAELAALEREAQELLGDIQGTVGGMSDLRYGRLGNQNLRSEVLGALKGLEDLAEKK